jgi:SAM-dependent methyltransferase
VDEAKLHAFMGALIQGVTGAAVSFGVWLGDEVGLYRALAGAGPLTADALAARSGTNAKLVGEWLKSQAAAGILAVDAEAGTYELSEEGAMLLADETSPVFLARGVGVIGAWFKGLDKIAAAYRGDGGMAWGEHDACLFAGTEWFFRPGYRAFLANEWIPAMDGVAAKLGSGATIADIGCGHGASAVVLAQAYPNSRVHAIDLHEPSVQTAGKRAAEAGVGERISFEVASAKSYTGNFDLICFFDTLHDMGDPVGAMAYAREHLNEGGSVLLVEPFALDGPANLTDNPVSALLYMASAALCTPNSLSQEVGLGIGTQAGPARLRDVAAQAGLHSFEIVAQTPINLVIQVRR